MDTEQLKRLMQIALLKDWLNKRHGARYLAGDDQRFFASAPTRSNLHPR